MIPTSGCGHGIAVSTSGQWACYAPDAGMAGIYSPAIDYMKEDFWAAMPSRRGMELGFLLAVLNEGEWGAHKAGTIWV